MRNNTKYNYRFQTQRLDSVICVTHEAVKEYHRIIKKKKKIINSEALNNDNNIISNNNDF